MLTLKTHLIVNNNGQASSEIASRLTNMAKENEKNQLTEEIYKLRELLSELKVARFRGGKILFFFQRLATNCFYFYFL
jgi:hypothetical protein